MCFVLRNAHRCLKVKLKRIASHGQTRVRELIKQIMADNDASRDVAPSSLSLSLFWEASFRFIAR